LCRIPKISLYSEGKAWITFSFHWSESIVWFCRHHQLVLFHVRFEVFKAVTMKNGVFWDVTPCGSCKNRRSSETSVPTRTTRRSIPEDIIIHVVFRIVTPQVTKRLLAKEGISPVNVIIGAFVPKACMWPIPCNSKHCCFSTTFPPDCTVLAVSSLLSGFRSLLEGRLFHKTSH
jgi:hypothetical protein